MSEISAWQEATSDMDEVVARPEGGEATQEPVSAPESVPEPAAENGAPLLDATAMVAVSVEGDEVEPAPGEPLLLLADHSGETVETENDHDELHQDELELEHGIASVIASLYADSRDDSAVDLQAEEAEDSGDVDDVEVDDAITYRLLGELDRLWHRAA